MPACRILSVAFDTINGITRNVSLAHAGYIVSPATSTTRAFELLEKHKFHLVIIGHEIPTAERRLLFLEINRKWNVPILLVDSGEADPMMRARAHVSHAAGSEAILAAVAGLVPTQRGKKALLQKRILARPQPLC